MASVRPCGCALSVLVLQLVQTAGAFPCICGDACCGFAVTYAETCWALYDAGISKFSMHASAIIHNMEAERVQDPHCSWEVQQPEVSTALLHVCSCLLRTESTLHQHIVGWRPFRLRCPITAAAGAPECPQRLAQGTAPPVPAL